MTLNRIYRIVANEVDATMPSQEVMNITKEVASTYPDDTEEVLQALDEIDESDLEDDEEECEDEDTAEGERQDPNFKSLLDDNDDQE